MKLFSLLLPLAALSALAQTTPPTPAPRNPTPTQAKAIKARTAERRAKAYKGPHVVQDSKALGREFIQESKPAPTVVAPVKQ